MEMIGKLVTLILRENGLYSMISFCNRVQLRYLHPPTLGFVTTQFDSIDAVQTHISI